MYMVYNRVRWDSPVIDSVWNIENEALNRKEELDKEMEERGFESERYGWEIIEIPVGQKNLFIELEWA